MFKRNDLIQDLVDYIKKNLKKGYTKESLRWALINQGYSKIEVERAIKKAEEDLANTAPLLRTKPEIKYQVLDSESSSSPSKKRGFFEWLRKFI